MRALVTGAGGFVGPHLVRHLVDEGDDVLAFDLSNGPDLLDADSWCDLVAEREPEVIVHLAAWSDVGGSWRHPDQVWRVNTEGTLSVLEAARRAGTQRVLLVSSADVYGVVAPTDLPLTEDTPARPRSPYGASKVGAETLALQYFRGHGLETVIARPFNHIGPGQSDNFVAAAFAARIAACESGLDDSDLERAAPPTVTHGDLSPRRDFTDVRDVVRAYRRLSVDGRPGHVYNVCSGADVGMHELLDRLVSLSTTEIATVEDRTLFRPVELPVLRGSHQRLTDDTGWAPSIPLEQTLADVLEDARTRCGGTRRSPHDPQPTPTTSGDTRS